MSVCSAYKRHASLGRGEEGENGENVCDVRDSILEELSEKSWNFEDALINGYELKIVADGEVSLIKEEGIVTKNYRGALQPFTKRGTDYEVSFKAYYS